MKKTLGKRAQRFSLATCSKLKNNEQRNRQDGLLQPYKNASSPCLAAPKTNRHDCLPRSYSAVFHSNQMLKYQSRAFSTATRSEKDPAGVMQSLEAACVCPCPGNCCLPPPCNTPPKCIQYMTGYYYYPYGTWFCGPYHVATGPCGPCTGPVVPGGPCGPCGPCPGGPCGPPGLACACGPLRCCGVCGSPNFPQSPMSSNTPNAFSTNAQFVPFSVPTQGMYTDANAGLQYSYDPTPAFSPYPPDSSPWSQPNMPNPNMPSHNMPGPFFGPGINVPITPIPFNTEPCGPIVPTPNQSPSSPKPKSSVRLNRDYVKEPYSGASYGSKPPMSAKPPTPKSSVYLSKPYTSKRAISTTQHVCSSNLTPKPLRQILPSRFEAICALARRKVFVKPRINNRTAPPHDMVQICYYTTRTMKTYAHNDVSSAGKAKNQRKSHKKNRQSVLSPSFNHKVANSEPLCCWCMISGKNTCPCQNCGLPSAQKGTPMSGIRSQRSQNQSEGTQNETHLEKKPLNAKHWNYWL